MTKNETGARYAVEPPRVAALYERLLSALSV